MIPSNYASLLSIYLKFLLVPEIAISLTLAIALSSQLCTNALRYSNTVHG